MNRIYTNDPLEYYDGALEELKEEEGFEDGDDTGVIFDRAYDMVEQSLDDEVTNLDIETKGEIFLMGTMERWDGPRTAYKGLGVKNIGEAMTRAMSSFSGDNTFEIGVENGEVTITQLGHDNPTNPSRFVFREVKNGMNLDDMTYENGDTPQILLDDSLSLADRVCEVYGWDTKTA